MNSQTTHTEHPPVAPAFLRETEALRDLRVLEAVEADPGVSQRELARNLGIAVGVVNACLRALVRKGMVKVRGESNRSVTYHLTKSGLLHKSALAFDWTRNTLGFYRQARGQVSDQFAQLAASGHRFAVVFGAAELAEIAVLVAPRAGITVVGVLAEGPTPLGEDIAGIPVTVLASAGELRGAGETDVIVLTEDATPEQLFVLAAMFPTAARFSLLGGNANPREVV
jgi:predicted transcriptional regulator